MMILVFQFRHKPLATSGFQFSFFTFLLLVTYGKHHKVLAIFIILCDDVALSFDTNQAECEEKELTNGNEHFID